MRRRLLITPKVQAALRTFPPETKRTLRRALEDICKDPWIGKPLRDEFAGLYSLRARRFRVIYQIQRQTITVVVIAIGPRERVYEELAAGMGPA
ncbi:MAG: type II toxin-antitoxin system RelE/ParE family toxin [Candidatus Omnitrophica bacterium]|nr:type II toxin-antitoxin system RelE/ParE family toxin [Candidatus Omnitrophota bacterium]